MEPPAGEPVRGAGLSQGGHSIRFRNTHAGKKSLKLNLKDPRDKELLLKLLDQSDVLVEGFRPGVMARLGLDYATVSARAQRTLVEALEWLTDVDCCYAPLRTLFDGIHDPSTATRGMLLTDDTGLAHLTIPIKYHHEPGKVDFEVPELGQHSKENARRLGYNEADAAELIADGII